MELPLAQKPINKVELKKTGTEGGNGSENRSKKGILTVKFFFDLR